jgi:hypothetical protein
MEVVNLRDDRLLSVDLVFLPWCEWCRKRSKKNGYLDALVVVVEQYFTPPHRL